jgi:hypothetical protein
VVVRTLGRDTAGRGRLDRDSDAVELHGAWEACLPESGIPDAPRMDNDGESSSDSDLSSDSDSSTSKETDT